MSLYPEPDQNIVAVGEAEERIRFLMGDGDTSEQPNAQLGVSPPHLERRIPSLAGPATSKKGNRHPILSRLGINKKPHTFCKDERRLYKFAQQLNARVKRLEKSKNNIKAAMVLAKDEHVRHLIEDLTPVQQRFFESQLRISINHREEVLRLSIVSFYKQIVAEATAVGFNIIASVCNMGSNNVKAINDLLDYSKILQTSEDDVAFRNGFLERDCQFSTHGARGQQQRVVARWDHIKQVVDIDREKNRVFRLLPKISAKHVDKFKIPKMKVSIAAQVMNQRVAAVMNKFASSESGRLPPDAQYTAKLLLKMVQIFDSVNGGFGGKSEKKDCEK
ncbi:hypothetical protein TcasGA2_TC004082 [Tribolium castaneum]|uniref:Transposable element P transposase-like GTP-binding insertion domain-containing protein n=1 Tax=Tribolium castaneum TaxID=7070 RepID=D7EKS9_TRICA|nr:hypothetical protein TcasGA2_TC004082 [Tribolium castaneum]